MMKKCLVFLIVYLIIFPAFSAYRTGYDFGAFMPGVPVASAKIRLPVMRILRIPAGVPNKVCTALTAPTATYTVEVRVGSIIGNLVWAAASTTCTVTGTWASSDIDLNPGNIIELMFQASQDATFADITIGIPVTRP